VEAALVWWTELKTRVARWVAVLVVLSTVLPMSPPGPIWQHRHLLISATRLSFIGPSLRSVSTHGKAPLHQIFVVPYRSLVLHLILILVIYNHILVIHSHVKFNFNKENSLKNIYIFSFLFSTSERDLQLYSPFTDD